MVTVNAPFYLALIVILIVLPVKLVEGYLFKEKPSSAETEKEQRAAKTLNYKNNKTHRTDTLKKLFFFDRANLKRPWYTGIPVFIFVFTNSMLFQNRKFPFLFWVTYCIAAYFFIIAFEIWTLLRVNKDYFSDHDRKRRYLKTQLAQGIVAFCLLVAFIFGLLSYMDWKNSDPISITENIDWVLEPEYEGSWPQFTEGLVPLSEQGKYGYLDKTGKSVIPFQYDSAWNFSEGLAAVERKGKWGYIDKEGRQKIPMIYDSAMDFNEGVAPVKRDGQWIVIDDQGKVLFETDYEWIGKYSDGYAYVEVKDPKYYKRTHGNYLDKQGKLLLPESIYQKYDIWEGFSEGCFPAHDKESNKFCYLDENGEKTIKQGYLDAHSFTNGYALVTLETGERARIDRNGNILEYVPEENYFEYDYNEGLKIYTEETGEDIFRDDLVKKGLKDRFGNILLPANFRSVTPSSEGLIGIRVNDRWGFIENPLPKPARGVDPELWIEDRTVIATVGGREVYAGELELYAYSLRKENPDIRGTAAYKMAFEQLKKEKVRQVPGEVGDPSGIRYQIGGTYYKLLLLN
ncbi:WG repeat-containing protein [Sinanaerobacter chloroacetimidivorans]|uniref:WG repeat-containing protein n=1 Tax=Sinanaerobacter chloroacetimidivorans TaxID=2818044 RepID=A0A8J7W6N6_9FIRM|nr:WG repeat-containing protein [Sinanaerobacter chloroacetimidivorans]MBR0599915.1 WG repeat-containing protein [Sinanaerobacter chloroacetimidivorans]